MNIQFWGAAGEVTGSCALLSVGERRILIDCGLFQGSKQTEERNRRPFPFDVDSIDAVILTHAHIDHSGRLPLLLKQGCKAKIYTHKASQDLCRILLLDSAFLMEKDTEIGNKKRLRKGLKPHVPLYSRTDVKKVLNGIIGVEYNKEITISPEIKFRLLDAGHILGSAIVELTLSEKGKTKKVIFSGDLGHYDVPILRDPSHIGAADWVIMESTYGNRCHRSQQETLDEIGSVIREAQQDKGNILIPSFAVGRSQELLYLFSKNYDEWGMGDWTIFLDSPLAIEATETYLKYPNLYDEETIKLLNEHSWEELLPNLHISRTAIQSMHINRIKSGAIIIAGSGMCTGGRIKHHLKHNVWKRNTHIMIVGFQAQGTLGRSLVDGAQKIRLWGETIKVAAQVHTIGGLSAHADQRELLNWVSNIKSKTNLILVHGEEEPLKVLKRELKSAHPNYPIKIPSYGERIELN